MLFPSEPCPLESHTHYCLSSFVRPNIFRVLSLPALPVGEPFGLVLGMIVSHGHLVLSFSSAPTASTIPKADITQSNEKPFNWMLCCQQSLYATVQTYNHPIQWLCCTVVSQMASPLNTTIHPIATTCQLPP
jgi:hypothetical protein